MDPKSESAWELIQLPSRISRNLEFGSLLRGLSCQSPCGLGEIDAVRDCSGSVVKAGVNPT